MDGVNWIYAYYQRIKDGSVYVGKWVRLVYEYIVTGLREKRLRFDQKSANEAISWIEDHAFHVEGPLAPGPLSWKTGRRRWYPAYSGSWTMPATGSSGKSC